MIRNLGIDMGWRIARVMLCRPGELSLVGVVTGILGRNASTVNADLPQVYPNLANLSIPRNTGFAARFSRAWAASKRTRTGTLKYASRRW